MPSVIAINDLSGLGKCSLTAALPVLAALGVQACPLPTAVLTNQTGFPSYTIWEQPDAFDHFVREWKAVGRSFDGIFTGFFTGEAQLARARAFVREFRSENTLLLVDPVMADNGALYSLFTADFAASMREFVRMADIATPNVTELCLLCGADYAALTVLPEEARLARVGELGGQLLAAGTKAVVVTGVPMGERLCNVICTADGTQTVFSRRHGGSYSGTGDLFAAAVGGAVLQGDSLRDAVIRATAFIEVSVRDTVAQGTAAPEGLCFEPHLHLLTAMQKGDA